MHHILRVLCYVPMTLGITDLNIERNVSSKRHNYGHIEKEVVTAMCTLLFSHITEQSNKRVKIFSKVIKSDYKENLVIGIELLNKNTDSVKFQFLGKNKCKIWDIREIITFLNSSLNSTGFSMFLFSESAKSYLV